MNKYKVSSCGKPAYVDPDTLQAMENINKVYAVIHCTDSACGNVQILDGTFPDDRILTFDTLTKPKK